MKITSVLLIMMMVLLAPWNICAQNGEEGHSLMKQMKKGEYVVILHGIFLSSHHMRKLAHYLEREGYEVINLDYPSTKQPLEILTSSITSEIKARLVEKKKVHFVGYSMGGLLLRAILTQYHPEQLGRVVQLAPPNNGSEVANFLQNIWAYQIFYGPAGQQLVTDQALIAPLFGEINYGLGVVAGNASLDPISSFLIPGIDDGKVSVKSTRVKGMKDHIVISATHTFFPYSKEAQKQTAYFLKHGFFLHKMKGGI